jgi:amino acid transporter
MMIGEAHWSEISLAVVSLISVILCIVALREALTDEAFWVAQGTHTKSVPPELLVATGTVREESLRLCACIVAFLLSIVVIVVPPPPPSFDDRPQALWTMISMNIIIFVLILKTALRRLVRKHVSQASGVVGPLRRRKDDVA